MPLALSRKGLAVLALLALSAAAAVAAAVFDHDGSVPGLAAQATLLGVPFAATFLGKPSGKRIGARMILGLLTAVKVLELGRAALG
jgi:hypothetical protein